MTNNRDKPVKLDIDAVFGNAVPKISHTVRVVLIKWIHRIPHLVMVHQNAREEGYLQKDGTWWFERERIGLPGGRNDPKKPLTADADGITIMETLIETAVREAKEETGIILPEDFFTERLSFHSELRRSDREEFDFCQDHYYFGELPEDMVFGEITEKSEIKEALFIPLSKIPLPGDAVPFSWKQQQGMLALFQSLETKAEDASYYAVTLKKRAAMR
ncbi:MAG: NUDIX hydrolase [Candidatus Paceibacterota bacterium]|jgi:8-oxo-dGTP pyrophosphatase MutT (NUDIX family)